MVACRLAEPTIKVQNLPEQISINKFIGLIGLVKSGTLRGRDHYYKLASLNN